MKNRRFWFGIIATVFVLSFVSNAIAAESNIDVIRKAAEQGDAEAQYTLSGLYFRGEGVPKDDTKGGQWLTKAAQQGHPEARAIFQNIIFSETLKAAQQGGANYQFDLAELYRKGIGTPRDFQKAFRWYEKSAKQGHARSQFYVGAHFHKAKDYSQAGDWISRSAMQGYAPAQSKMGKILYAAKDFDEAARLFQASAEQGHSEAQAFLSTMYVQGKGVPENYVYAYSWASLSAAAKVPLGLTVRDEVVKLMTKEQIVEAQQLAPTLIRISKK